MWQYCRVLFLLVLRSQDKGSRLAYPDCRAMVSWLFSRPGLPIQYWLRPLYRWYRHVATTCNIETFSKTILSTFFSISISSIINFKTWRLMRNCGIIFINSLVSLHLHPMKNNTLVKLKRNCTLFTQAHNYASGRYAFLEACPRTESALQERRYATP